MHPLKLDVQLRRAGGHVIDGVQVEMTRPVAADLDQHLVRAWLRLRISARISHPSGPWQLP
jgi:hypothetical protein